MSNRGPSVVFVGDLGDPWVAAIADGLPPWTSRLDLPDELPETWTAPALLADAIVLHRPALGIGDGRRLESLRSRPGGPPKVVLCMGAHARYHQLARWEGLADVVLDEMTAVAVAGLHLDRCLGRGRIDRRIGAGRRVAVVCSVPALRDFLVEAVRRHGFEAEASATWEEAPPGIPAVWAVPSLDPGWDRELSRASAARPVVALLGLIDRAAAGLALAAGASAFLGLPCAPEDLVFLLDRVARGRIPQ